jgi:cytoskeletal protein RodZ
MTTTALIAAVLVLATGVSVWQAVRATRAEQRAAKERDNAMAEKGRADEQAAIAKAVNNFLNKGVLDRRAFSTRGRKRRTAT